MKTRKRAYRKRDPESMKKLLIDSVGQVLVRYGHGKINASQIALMAGVDKNMVNWHFGSLNNLVKAYIHSKDFWKPVLEKFELMDSPTSDNLREYITSIFREQFSYFSSETEMQKFIHWQVSESNPVLRAISDERERKASKIIDLTDEHFKGSKISLRSVLAIILGGIYYTVWHAANNGSVVCGIDINNEKERIEFDETIELLLKLVWDAAGS